MLDMITRNELMPTRVTGKHSFVTNGRTSFPDVLSVNRRMRHSWKKSSFMDWYSSSDHLYISHEFARKRNRPARGNFKFSTKTMDVNKFLNKLDEYLDITVNDEAAHGVQFQKCLERTCAVELKKTIPPRGKRNINYWWNDELSVLRGTTLNLRRRAQRAVAASWDNAGHLATVFNEARRRVKKAVERSKEMMWKEFCATLDQDPYGGKPYRAIRIKIARKTPPGGLRNDRVERILENLFVTRIVKQGGDAHRFRINLRITEDDHSNCHGEVRPEESCGCE
jgi:hypothetical protein